MRLICINIMNVYHDCLPQITTEFGKKMNDKKSILITGGDTNRLFTDLQSIFHDPNSIIVATPGRLIEICQWFKNNGCNDFLHNLKYLALMNGDKFTQTNMILELNKLIPYLPTTNDNFKTISVTTNVAVQSGETFDGQRKHFAKMIGQSMSYSAYEEEIMQNYNVNNNNNNNNYNSNGFGTGSDTFISNEIEFETIHVGNQCNNNDNNINTDPIIEKFVENYSGNHFLRNADREKILMVKSFSNQARLLDRKIVIFMSSNIRAQGLGECLKAMRIRDLVEQQRNKCNNNNVNGMNNNHVNMVDIPKNDILTIGAKISNQTERNEQNKRLHTGKYTIAVLTDCFAETTLPKQADIIINFDRPSEAYSLNVFRQVRSRIQEEQHRYDGAQWAKTLSQRMSLVQFLFLGFVYLCKF